MVYMYVYTSKYMLYQGIRYDIIYPGTRYGVCVRVVTVYRLPIRLPAKSALIWPVV